MRWDESRDIIKKASSSVLSLTSKNLAKFRCSSKNKAMWMSSGCVYTHPLVDITLILFMFMCRGVLYSYRRGLSALLVLDTSGNARAFRSGMSSKSSSHVFLFMPYTTNKELPTLGIGGTKRKQE